MPLPNGYWGLTNTEKITIEFDVCKPEGEWYACPTAIKGHYSVQISVLHNVTGPSPGGNTNEANFCPQAFGLSHFSGQIATSNWFMEAAIRDHEDVHKAHLLPALEAIRFQIEGLILGMTAVDYGQDAEAVKAYMTVNLLPDVLKEALDLWDEEFESRWNPTDHGTGYDGPSYVAEGLVTEPMKLSICFHAQGESWPDCTWCPPS